MVINRNSIITPSAHLWLPCTYRHPLCFSHANAKNTIVSPFGSAATGQEAAALRHAVTFLSRALKRKKQGSIPKKQTTKCEHRDMFLRLAEVCSTDMHRMFLLVSTKTLLIPTGNS
jgi:hypothetical protein